MYHLVLGPTQVFYDLVMLFSFRALWSTGNYFKGAREQANCFGDLGSLAEKEKIKLKKNYLKTYLCLIFKIIFGFCGLLLSLFLDKYSLNCRK